jgi:hypothetical protein
VYTQWKWTGVKFVGVALLDEEDACRAFVQRYHLSFPNGYDGKSNVANLYGFTYQPYWAVIDRDGALLSKGFGPPNEEVLAATVRKLTGR